MTKGDKTLLASEIEIKTPYLDLLPPMADHERQALRNKIETEGYSQNHPILVDESGNVLDGHNRLSINPDAPVQVIAGLSEAQKRARVITENFARRNLSPEQKKHVDKTRKQIAIDLKHDGLTQDEIARVFGVTRQAVSLWLGDTTNASDCDGCIPDARTKIGKGEVGQLSTDPRPSSPGQASGFLWTLPSKSARPCGSL